MVTTPVEKLREDLRESNTNDLKRRRAIIGISLFGMANMALATLRQTGILRRLPEPPLKGFDSNKVSVSDDAYVFGSPDGPIALASFAANLPIAALGSADRAKDQPWAPIAATAKSAADVAAAAWYVYRMPTKERAWCIYCIMTALAEVGVFALTLPEAMKAVKTLHGAS